MTVRGVLRRAAAGTLAAATLLLGTAHTAHAAPQAPEERAPRAAPRTTPPAPPAPAALRAFLDEEVPARLAARNIPGAAVTVVSGTDVISAGYGIADTARGNPVDPARTRFFTGSVGKVFTGIAVMQQVERGRLDLSADVNRYLADAPFTIADTFPGRPVTVGDLLTHTSGFDTGVYGVGHSEPEVPVGMAAHLRTHQPARVRPPGTAASYDNYGLTLAGHLVERVSGRPFASYVEEHILRPLAMTQTTFDQHDPRVPHPDTATGHRPAGGGQQRARGQFGPMTAAGAGSVTTAADMARLIQALLDDGRAPTATHRPTRTTSGTATPAPGTATPASGTPAPGTATPAPGTATLAPDPRILRPATNTALLSRHFGPDPRIPGMAYVFTQNRREGRTLLLKDGDLPGFHTLLALLPDRDTGLYVSFNGDGDDATAAHAARDLVNEFVARFHPADREPANGATGHALPAGADSESGNGAPGEALTADADRESENGATEGALPADHAGSYRSTRTSQNDLSAASALLGDVTVTVAADGVLTTEGPLSPDPARTTQHWIPAGPHLYRERGGQDVLAFKDGMLLSGQDPTVAYTRIPWYASAALHRTALLTAVAVLSTALLGWPATALVRRLRRAAAPTGPAAARAVGWTTAALPVLFCGLFLALAADPNAMNEAVFLGGSPLLTGSLLTLAAAVPLTATTLVLTVLAVRRGWWGRAGRLHFALVGLSAAVFLAALTPYHLVVRPLLG
ncbi:serine hydrolase domain-containing protein [Streptomyces sp. CA-294286]|uniref:serine hydrolase domain-containing protein n=1 Tax=Streptomyces sp. CA-294286 TaxID=3240070 RepID=UPI003D8B4B90